MARRAVIVGAGAIGLTAAWALRRRGLDVTVIERGEPGMGCSFGNAGFICPTLSAPLPSPGLVGRSLHWMLRADSPLYIKPSALAGMLPWLLAFWRSCNARDHEAGLAAMATLNRRTLELYDTLAEDGVAFEMHRHGLMFLFLSERQLTDELVELRRAAAYGLPAPQALDRRQVLAVEPEVSMAVAGGILLPEERHLEPRSLSQGLVRRLGAMGVEIRSGAGVTSFERRADQVVAVQAGGERIGGDLFVLAAGAGTGRLAARLGARLPIQAGKGYSLTFPADEWRFRHALYFGDTKAVLSQFAGALRIAGTMEFSGLNDRLDRRRLEGLRSAVGRYLAQDVAASGGEAWVGMRPMTPDGLPVIGRLKPWRNAFVSTGHAANGIFMAPVSAELLAAAVMGDEESGKAFSPDRLPGEDRRYPR